MKREDLQDLEGDCLSRSFYLREDVVQISRELLGKFLCTRINGIYTAGMIVETEAYRGPDDRACHAYNYRRTPRTETMYQPGGCAYVYLCYGIHHLFNVVTGPADHAHAVLIRGLQPVDHVEDMLRRRKLPKLKTQLSAGPGVLSVALGIRTELDGSSLLQPDGPIWIEDRGIRTTPEQIAIGTRVGVESAGEDAFRPWRFHLKNNRWVSPGKGARRK